MSAKDLFFPAGKKHSTAEERSDAREDLIYNVTEDLLVIMEDMDITKKELAKMLGKSKSFVSQLLSGSRNMTLGTLSDVSFALGFTPEINLPVKKLDQQYEKWGAVVTNLPTKKTCRKLENTTNVYRFDTNKTWQRTA